MGKYDNAKRLACRTHVKRQAKQNREQLVFQLVRCATTPVSGGTGKQASAVWSLSMLPYPSCVRISFVTFVFLRPAWFNPALLSSQCPCPLFHRSH